MEVSSTATIKIDQSTKVPASTTSATRIRRKNADTDPSHESTAEEISETDQQESRDTMNKTGLMSARFIRERVTKIESHIASAFNLCN